MQVNIKLSQDEIEAICIQHCTAIMPAPEGMHWECTIRVYSGAVCSLEKDRDKPPMEEPIPSVFPAPVATEEEVAF